jgi:hypothetical protein
MPNIFVMPSAEKPAVFFCFYHNNLLTKNTAFKKAKLKTFYFLLNAATEIP